MTKLLNHPQVRPLLSDDHFSVDGTLIEAWASQKSFRPKDGSGDDDGGANFHGQKCKNDSHASTTDPDSRLYRKAAGREAKLCYMTFRRELPTHHCYPVGRRRAVTVLNRRSARGDVRGVERADDRRVISGIVHVLKSGCRWYDCPEAYGPPTTIYNRFVRWARRGIWENLFRELAANGRSADTQMIDSTHVKAHRSAAGGKGGSRSRLLAVRAGATRRFTHSQMLRDASSPSC
jgi:transposase